MGSFGVGTMYAMAYDAWLDMCDRIAGLMGEGRMTDDFPDFDWAAAYAWGETPVRAVMGALMNSA